MLRVILFLTSLVTAVPLFAQPDVQWTECFGGNQNEEATAVKAAPDGGFVVSGWGASEPTQAYVAWINPTGQLQFFGQDLDSLGGRLEFRDVAVASDGYIFAGSRNVDQLTQDAWLMKRDFNFNTLWQRQFGGDARDAFQAVTATPDGGCTAAGFTESFGSRDVYVVRTSSNGDVVWEQHFGMDSLDEAFDIALAANGDFVITGVSHHPSNQYGYMLVARLTSGGDTLWTRRINSHEMTIGHAIEETGDGSVVAAGCSDCWSSASNLFMIRFTADGTEQTRRNVTNFPESAAIDFVTLPDNGFMLMGCQHCLSPAYEMLLVKVNSSFEYQHSRSYGDYRGNGIALTDDGGYVMATWHSTTEGPVESCVTRTFPDALSAPESPIAVPNQLLLSAYPNPFNAIATIAFTLPQSGNVELSIFDVTGRRVKTLTNGMMNAGEHQLIFVAADLPSGLYFAHLEAVGQSRTQKLLLVK